MSTRARAAHCAGSGGHDGVGDTVGAGPGCEHALEVFNREGGRHGAAKVDVCGRLQRAAGRGRGFRKGQRGREAARRRGAARGARRPCGLPVRCWSGAAARWPPGGRRHCAPPPGAAARLRRRPGRGPRAHLAYGHAADGLWRGEEGAAERAPNRARPRACAGEGGSHTAVEGHLVGGHDLSLHRAHDDAADGGGGVGRDGEGQHAHGLLGCAVHPGARARRRGGQQHGQEGARR
jgi:hypothetical protein